MNCWEILGIDPTRDHAVIDRAYEQQKKFATGEDMDRLEQAYRQARGENSRDETFRDERSGHPPQQSSKHESGERSAAPSQQATDTPPAAAAELTADEQQIVREVVIQVKALLNDSRRASDDGIWKAILTEPPADQPHLRAAVADALEQQVRPMADNGSFPAPVVAFLGDWFGWQELQDARRQAPVRESHDTTHEMPEDNAEEGSQGPDTSFWPAVVGWIVALAVLAVVFDSIFSG